VATVSERRGLGRMAPLRAALLPAGDEFIDRGNTSNVIAMADPRPPISRCRPFPSPVQWCDFNAFQK